MHTRNGIKQLIIDRCKNKNKLSEPLAFERAKELTTKEGKLVVPYYCHKCWAFHIGHDTPKSTSN
jgi:hypothetical protein